MANPHLTVSRSLYAVSLAIALSLTPAPVSAQPYFGSYDVPNQSPLDRPTSMAQHGHFANTTMNVRWWVESDWADARANGLGVIVQWPQEFWYGDTFAAGVDWTVALKWDRPMWTGFPGSTAVDWYFAMLRHRDQIVAFMVADEWDCNYGVSFRDWSATSCELMAKKIEANAGSIKTIFNFHGWNPPVWANYTAAWTDGLRRGVAGYRLPYWVDWFSFDAYAPWGNCFGNVTCPQLLAAIKSRLRADQRIVLLPRAFGGSYLGYSPDDYSVATTMYAYLAYAFGEPQVVAVIPFIEWSIPGSPITGWGSRPIIGETVKALGRMITNRQ